MTVHLINFHCIVTWGRDPDDLVNYGFIKQLQRGGYFADLVVVRKKYYKNRLRKINLW